MADRIGIIDYQMGNLRSVQKGLEQSGFSGEIFSDPNRMDDFDKLILPGVGAFRDAIRELTERELVGPIQDWVRADKPLLGICLGLQLLFDKSFEDGEYAGLGLIPGSVVRFELPRNLKVPHMGWNQVRRADEFSGWNTIEDDAFYYFVHSYYVRPDDDSVVALTANYGIDFCAAIRQGNLFATQFHPEKSQAAGLRILQQFAEGSWAGQAKLRSVST